VSVGTVTDTGSSIGTTAESAPPAQPTLTKAKACRDFRNFIDSSLSGTVQAQDIGIHTFQAACPAQANADGFGASYGTANQCASLDQHGCTAWHDPMLPVNAGAATIEADAHGG